MTAQHIRNAFDAGVNTAKGYKIGDVFLGATPEADRQGFGTDPLARTAFISGYIKNLCRPIVTTRDTNVLIQYGLPA